MGGGMDRVTMNNRKRKREETGIPAGKLTEWYWNWSKLSGERGLYRSGL
jgi:hypothetical protein